MRRTTIAMLVAGGAVLLSGSPDAQAEFLDVSGELTEVEIDGVCWDRWRLFATFDNPLDQLSIVSGNSTHPLVITTDGPNGFLQVDDPTGTNEDSAHTQFAVDFLPELAFDTFVTIDGTKSWVSDGLGPIQLDGESIDGGWNTPTAFGFDRLVIENGSSWRRVPVFPETSAPDGRVAFGQFTVDAGATLDGIVSLWMIQDGSASGPTVDIEFSFTSGAICESCPGDTNGDLVVDVDDIVNVILDWGTDGSANGGDADGSGFVDVDDVVFVVLEFGETCP